MKTLVFLLMFGSSTVFAGQGGSGGVGFQCDGQIYLADTYNLIRGTGDDLLGDSIELLNHTPPEQLEKTILDGLKSYLEQDGEGVPFQEIEAAKNQLHFIYKEKVRRTHDDHIEFTPCGGPVIQLARQDKKGNVEMAKIAKRMSSLEQVMLKIHEIRLRWLINRQNFNGDTTPVRSWVSKFVQMKLSELINFVVKKPYKASDIPEDLVYSSCEKQVLIETEQEIIKMGLPKEDYFGRPRLAGTFTANGDPKDVIWESHHTDGTYVRWEAAVLNPEVSWGCWVRSAVDGHPVNLPVYRGEYIDKASWQKWFANGSSNFKCSVTVDESFVNSNGRRVPMVRISGQINDSVDKLDISVPSLIVAEIPWSQVKADGNSLTGSIQNASGTTGFSISLNAKKYADDDGVNLTPRFKQEAESVSIWNGTQHFDCKDLRIFSAW